MREMHRGKASDQASTGGQPEIGVPVRAQKRVKWQTEHESYEAENRNFNVSLLTAQLKNAFCDYHGILNSSAGAADDLEGMQRSAPLPASDRPRAEAQVLPNCSANYQLPAEPRCPWLGRLIRWASEIGSAATSVVVRN
jgi:hypothetical protein